MTARLKRFPGEILKNLLISSTKWRAPIILDTDCQQRPNGSMYAVLEQTQNSHLATMQANCPNMLGLKIIPKTELIRLEPKNPIPGIFTICTAISGNGWKITGTITTMAHRMMAVPGLMAQEALTAWSAAAAGATLRGSAGRRFAATAGPARPAAASAVSAFVLPGPLPLVLDPLDPLHSNRPGAK